MEPDILSPNFDFEQSRGLLLSPPVWREAEFLAAVAPVFDLESQRLAFSAAS
jgi:hypothetical protein